METTIPDAILTDATPSTLVRAIHDNLFEMYRYLGRSQAAEYHHDPELTWLRTPIAPVSFLNGVLHTAASAERLDTLIHTTIEYYRSKGVMRFSWWLDERSPYLAAHLQAHGLVFIEGNLGMTLDLHPWEDDLSGPADLRVEPVNDMQSLLDWVLAAQAGFDLPEIYRQPWYEIYAGLGCELPLRNYVGYYRGEPVAAAQLFLGAGVAGIYTVATVPSARRLGIGAAMTQAALREAQDFGYRYAILHASRIGEGVYAKLGFRGCCHMSRFIWEETS